MSDQTNCNEVEAEECDAYEENQEEPVAMIEESPPSVGPDGMTAESCTTYCPCRILFLRGLVEWFLNLSLPVRIVIRIVI